MNLLTDSELEPAYGDDKEADRNPFDAEDRADLSLVMIRPAKFGGFNVEQTRLQPFDVFALFQGRGIASCSEPDSGLDLRANSIQEPLAFRLGPSTSPVWAGTAICRK